MKTIPEILADRRDKKDREQDRTALASDLSTTTFRASSNQIQGVNDAISYLAQHGSELNESQRKQLSEEGIKINNIQDFPKPELAIQLRGLDKIDVKTMKVDGLEEALGLFAEEIAHLRKTIDNIQTRVPNVTLPEIKVPPITIPKSNFNVTVPQPKVTVHVPPIEMPKPEEAKKPPRLMSEKHEQNGRGQLVSITERYEDGSVHKVTGLDTGEITHAYR